MRPRADLPADPAAKAPGQYNVPGPYKHVPIRQPSPPEPALSDALRYREVAHLPSQAL